MKTVPADSRRYIHSAYTDFHLFLIELLLIIVTIMLSVLGHWIYFFELFLIIFLKLFTSFRLYPLFSSICISNIFVCKDYYGFCARILLLSEAYVYEKTFHGLRYAIFSPNPITNVHWKDIAKNRQVIVYPVVKRMRRDFPDLFKRAETL